MDDPDWRWDGRSNNWAGNMTGLFNVEFTNKEVREINVARNIIDTQGFPIYMEDVDGKLYNWGTIISLKKQQE